MNKSKSKQAKSQFHKNSTKKEKSIQEIPYSNPSKLKVHKSTRPFGKDITNTFHSNIPYPVLNPHISNKNGIKTDEKIKIIRDNEQNKNNNKIIIKDNVKENDENKNNEENKDKDNNKCIYK